MNPFLLIIGLVGIAFGLVYLEITYFAVAFLGLGALAVLWFTEQKRSPNSIQDKQLEALHNDADHQRQLAQFNRAIVELIQQCQSNLLNIDSTQLDAVNTLSNSFNRLKSMTEFQSKQVQILLDNNDEEHGSLNGSWMTSFAQSTAITLDKFVEGYLEKVSAQMDCKVHWLDALQEKIVVRLLSNQQH